MARRELWCRSRQAAYSSAVECPKAAPLSNNNFPNGRAEIDFQALLAWHHQPPRIQPQLVQHGGVDIGHIMAFLHGVETEFIGCAVSHAALDPAACHPDAKAEGMVVAASSCSLDAG